MLLCPAGSDGYVEEAFGAGSTTSSLCPPTGAPRRGSNVPAGGLHRREGGRTQAGPAVATTHLGAMISVLGLKGGSGKTLTAANLAVALADAGNRVTIVDIDLQFGDVGLALGLSPERTVFDLIGSGGSLDAEKLEDFLAVHPSGARALLAPARPDQAGVVTSDFLRDVYAVLREVNDFVIIDTPPSFTPEVIAAVDSSTEVCMVAMLDSLSLKNSKLGLETLERMRFDRTGCGSCSIAPTERGHRPRGRRRDHGRRAADSGAERSQRHALDQPGRADRSGEPALRGRQGVPRARAAVHRGGAKPPPAASRRPPRRPRRRLFRRGR